MLPGETEAGSAGKQPCRGIARWKLIQTMRRARWSHPPARFLPSSEDRFPHALKIHAQWANYSLTQTGATPIPAEPRQVIDEKRSWNEAYLIRSFLQYNDSFEILFWNNLVYHKSRDILGALMPLCLENEGGSLWLRKLK